MSTIHPDDVKISLRPKAITRYFVTRIPTLRPPMIRLPNPIKQLKGMTRRTWLLFFAGFVLLHVLVLM